MAYLRLGDLAQSHGHATCPMPRGLTPGASGFQGLLGRSRNWHSQTAGVMFWGTPPYCNLQPPSETGRHRHCYATQVMATSVDAQVLPHLQMCGVPTSRHDPPKRGKHEPAPTALKLHTDHLDPPQQISARDPGRTGKLQNANRPESGKTGTHMLTREAIYASHHFSP